MKHKDREVHRKVEGERFKTPAGMHCCSLLHREGDTHSTEDMRRYEMTRDTDTDVKRHWIHHLWPSQRSILTNSFSLVGFEKLLYNFKEKFKVNNSNVIWCNHKEM